MFEIKIKFRSKMLFNLQRVAMIQKRHKVFILATLCAISLFLVYQRLTLLDLAGYEENTPKETLKFAIKEEVFETILNGTNITGNICLVGLSGALTDEWLQFIRQNKSLWSIFVVGIGAQELLDSKQVR
jgi:hypothetical protein